MRSVTHFAVSNPKPAKKANPRGQKAVTTIKPGKPTPLTKLSWRPLPIWFLRLHSIGHRFGLATYILIAGMLVAYSSTVYLQQKWIQEFRKLETLQHYERQLTITNEVLKNQLAAEAEQPSTGLITPNPAEAIILQASPQKDAVSFTSSNTAPPAKIDMPAGY